jgi:hypothetical protein
VGYHVDLSVPKRGQIVSRRTEEPAAFRHAEFGCGFATKSQEVFRDIAHDDKRGPSRERAKADQSLATSDIEHDVSVTNRRSDAAHVAFCGNCDACGLHVCSDVRDSRVPHVRTSRGAIQLR